MGLYKYEDNSFLRAVIRVIIYILASVSFAWFIVHSFMGQIIISGNSMTPALNAQDVCLIDTLGYQFFSPRRFDVIVFTREDTGKQNIKRVVGLPGETVSIEDGKIFINGEELPNEYTSHISLAGIAENAVELPEDEYFVVGDNADSSEDSRFENIGNVKKSSVAGKLWFIFSPIKRTGFIK